MATAGECHQFAKECIASAEQADTDDLRQTFLDLAQAWVKAAARLDGVMIPCISKDTVTKPDGR